MRKKKMRKKRFLTMKRRPPHQIQRKVPVYHIFLFKIRNFVAEFVIFRLPEAITVPYLLYR
jgi:hypothetical protein